MTLFHHVLPISLFASFPSEALRFDHRSVPPGLQRLRRPRPAQAPLVRRRRARWRGAGRGGELGAQGEQQAIYGAGGA